MPVPGSSFETPIKQWFSDRSELYPDIDTNRGVYTVIDTKQTGYVHINDFIHCSFFAIQCDNEEPTMTFKLSDIPEENPFHAWMKNKIDPKLLDYVHFLSFYSLIECYGDECLIMKYAYQHPHAVQQFFRVKGGGKEKGNIKCMQGDVTERKRTLIQHILTNNIIHLSNIHDQLLQQSHFVEVLPSGFKFFEPRNEVQKILDCLY